MLKQTSEPRIPPPRQIIQITTITPADGPDRLFALCRVPVPRIPQPGDK